MRTYITVIEGPVYFDAGQLGLVQYCGDEHFSTDVEMREEQLHGAAACTKR